MSARKLCERRKWRYPRTIRHHWPSVHSAVRASYRLGYKLPLIGCAALAFWRVGCGRGECTAAALSEFLADAIGVDPYPKWAGTAYEWLGGVRRLDIDSSPPDMLALEPFDFVHSYTVFEHIERPVEAL